MAEREAVSPLRHCSRNKCYGVRLPTELLGPQLGNLPLTKRLRRKSHTIQQSFQSIKINMLDKLRHFHTINILLVFTKYEAEYTVEPAGCGPLHCQLSGVTGGTAEMKCIQSWAALWTVFALHNRILCVVKNSVHVSALLASLAIYFFRFCPS